MHKEPGASDAVFRNESIGRIRRASGPCPHSHLLTSAIETHPLAQRTRVVVQSSYASARCKFAFRPLDFFLFSHAYEVGSLQRVIHLFVLVVVFFSSPLVFILLRLVFLAGAPIIVVALDRTHCSSVIICRHLFSSI